MEETNTIGTLLRSQRELKNISIQEISQKTKININVLRSLENDDLNKLPNKTYVKGFVKNYAKTIGLNIDDATHALENTYHSKEGTGPTTESKSELGSLQTNNTEESENEEMKETLISIIQGFMNKKVIYSLAGLIVFVVIVKGVVNFFGQINFETKKIASENQLKTPEQNLFESEKTAQMREEVAQESESEENTTPETVPESAQESIQAATPTKTDKPVVEVASTTPSSEMKKEEEDTSIDEVEDTESADVAILPAGKFPFKKFYPAPRNMFSVIENAPESNDVNLLPAYIKNLKLEGKQAVYIRAVDGDTWISYKVDDEKIKRYILKQGKHVLLKGETVLLFMGNINVTKIFLNGKLVETDSRTGVKSLIFPEEKAIDFELPLFPSYQGIPYAASEYKANMVEETSNN